VAVFSVVNSVLLKPLSYPDPERLVSLRQVAPGAAGLGSLSDGLLLSPSMYFTYAEHNRTFQSMGVWISGTANVTGLGEPEEVRTVSITDGVLQTLAVPAAAGRWLSQADQIPRGPESVMLSYGYWQRRFGGKWSAIGSNILVNSRPRQIAGIMPRDFRFVNAECDLIVPLAFDRAQLILAGFGFHGIARLKPDATIAQANADLTSLLPVWMSSWSNGPGTNPEFYKVWRITPDLHPLKQEVIGTVGNLLWVVMGTIGIVMLIVCANVANLLLVRAEGRHQELAVRAALGAGRGQIVRELLFESVLLGLGGGALGVGLAYVGLQLLAAMGPASLPRLTEISIDRTALLFTFALSLFSGVLFGLLPALRYAGPKISIALRSAGRSSSASRERHQARDILVIAQVAMAMVLLVSAGLMIRTFQTLRTVEPGFTHAGQVQTVRISIPRSLVQEQDRVVRLQNDITEKLAAIPGVHSVGFANALPMEGADTAWDEIQTDKPSSGADQPPVLRMFKFISPGVFQTIGTRMIAGRDFTWTDLHSRRPVAIVSESLARELWGSPSAAIGRQIHAGKPLHEVVGVVQDVHNSGIGEPVQTIVYWPTIVELYTGALDVTRTVTFAIRGDRTSTESFLSEVRNAVWAANPSLPLASVRTMNEIYEQSMARTSFTLVMLGISGAMALVLGVIGIYGVISYAVSQRKREIGIRMALGAQQGELKRMFVRSGLTLTAVGVTVGLVASAGLMRLMKALLFGISPMDPLTYATVPIVLMSAAVLASYLPARGAAAVDPVEALKAD
jgi:predicted permease